jgi:hypothetical protein
LFDRGIQVNSSSCPHDDTDATRSDGYWG